MSRTPEERHAYYLANKDDSLRLGRSWRAANPAAMKAAYARHRAKHRQHRIEISRAWHLAHPIVRVRRVGIDLEKARATRVSIDALRRARKRAATGRYTGQEWRDKCALLGNVCFYCGEAKRLEADHKIPLARGGTNDITNIIPACRSCNARKATKTVHEFLAFAEAA